MAEGKDAARAAHHHDHVHAADAQGAHAAIDAGEPRAEYRFMLEAIQDLLAAKGVFSAGDIRRQIELMDTRSAATGARLVARAWVDPAFKAVLLADSKAAAAAMEIDVADMPEVLVLENTSKRHHVVVCTLCSCYPKAILGMSPAWYKSAAYRARAVKDPRGVLKEFGTELAGDVEIRVCDSTADLRYLVLPMRPAGTEGWSEDRLATLVTRDSMIGVTTALSP
ncbi:MAG TPA: nitrile hydratase subunit alpha [Alphaproteobacteria bacterium]|nr:nitrile hydratase subunit alpha [Alphaproteobacteria bacterium]